MGRGARAGVQPFMRPQARQRLSYASRCADVADLIGADEADAWASNVAVSLYVLAGVAASDAVTGALQGERWKGSDHRGAIAFLREVVGGKEAGRALSDLLDLKDKAHCSASLISAVEERQAARRARQLLALAVVAIRR